MSTLPENWRIDESVRETTHNEMSREFPEYIEDQSTPATKTFAGYVSPDESTIIAVGELNRPGIPDNSGLYIYVYEVASGMDKAPFWLFSGGEDVDTARNLARKVVVARDETPYEPSDIEFLSDLRERVPELDVHTEFTPEDYGQEWVEEQGIMFESPGPTGHPLESYLSGYVAGIQFQKYWPSLECDEPECSAEIEGGNQSSWEMNSTLYIGETDEGVFVPVGWRCVKHPVENLDSFMAELPSSDVISEWETRLDEEQSLINERVEELEAAGAFDDDDDDDEDGPEWRRNMGKNHQARKELEEEGVLEEYTEAEQEERAKVMGLSMGPNIERYFLVRCNLDCLCFGGYYQNLSYIRNPAVLDEREYVY